MFTARNRAAKKEVSAGVHLPYLAQVDDDTLLTRNGQMMQLRPSPVMATASRNSPIRTTVRAPRRWAR